MAAADGRVEGAEEVAVGTGAGDSGRKFVGHFRFFRSLAPDEVASEEAGEESPDEDSTYNVEDYILWATVVIVVVVRSAHGVKR
jgi:hypothetical protein